MACTLSKHRSSNRTNLCGVHCSALYYSTEKADMFTVHSRPQEQRHTADSRLQVLLEALVARGHVLELKAADMADRNRWVTTLNAEIAELQKVGK